MHPLAPRPSVGLVLTALPPPPSLAGIAERVEARLRDVLEPEAARWGAFDPDLIDAIREIERLVLAGGKRLRPAFCHWGFVGAGGDPDARVMVDAGAAFELMHAFALFHDDVMDDASSRSRMRLYSTRAAPMQAADRRGSIARPRSADRYSSRQRATSKRMSAWNEPVQRRSARSTPNRRRSSCGMYCRARSRSSAMSRRKLVSWNALPRSRAWPRASGRNGSRIGSIISPITAAEPSM